MHRLVAVALQYEKSPVGANLRKVFDGMALGGAHRRTMLGIDRPDMHPVSVILSGRIDQAPAVLAEGDVRDFELSRCECSGRSSLHGDGIEMQPAAFLPGEHEIIMAGPEQVRRRGSVVIRRDRRTEYASGSRVGNPDTSPLAGLHVRRPDRPRPSAAPGEKIGRSLLSKHTNEGDPRAVR